MIGCKSRKFSIMYLGLPIGAKSRSKALLNQVIEKFEKKKFFMKEIIFIDGRNDNVNKSLSV